MVSVMRQGVVVGLAIAVLAFALVVFLSRPVSAQAPQEIPLSELVRPAQFHPPPIAGSNSQRAQSGFCRATG